MTSPDTSPTNPADDQPTPPVDPQVPEDPSQYTKPVDEQTEPNGDMPIV